jgi:3-oxoadipate enol-lactonase
MTNPQLEPSRSGHLEVDEQRVYWEYYGGGGREVVCLLNGLAMHTRAWSSFLPLVAARFDVLLFDYPGQGRSSCEDRPCFIPRLADYLALIADGLGIERLHLAGISYGGFVALDFARLHQDRLHTLTLSGILLTHETLFRMYQDLSLLFYRRGVEVFEVYTHYMYEKIFGEAFAARCYDQLDAMRQRFFERYKDIRHSLIRLTEAQDPFFATLDQHLPEYRDVRTPTLILAGEEDRAIPASVQRKICDILPATRMVVVPGCGHVVYLERPDVFFGALSAFAASRSLEQVGVGVA